MTMDPESPFWRWPKGSAARASAEANVLMRRAGRAFSKGWVYRMIVRLAERLAR